MMKLSVYAFLTLLFLSCKSSKDIINKETMAKAKYLAKEYIITDGHVDLPYRMKVQNFRMTKEFVGLPVSSKTGDFDYRRSKKGGLDAPFMSIFIPADKDSVESKKLADTLINMVKWLAAKNEPYFEIATSPNDVKRICARGKLALPMGMENGSPITTITDVAAYRKKGISYVTLTHGKVNQIADSSYDTIRKHNGLSSFGYEVVREMQEQGIMVDISHVSDSAFYDVIRFVKVPVIASHSSARKFTPGFERNMDDDMIKALGKNGGIIMINFGSTFLDGKIDGIREKYRKELDSIFISKGIKSDSKKADKIRKEFYKSRQDIYADVKTVADHIDHVKSLAGIEAIGLGSDFDGVGDSLPVGLKDVADYPNLIYELLLRGYSDTDIEKICSGNLFRVWQAVIDYKRR
jgi:membrane dipeptidase